MFTTVHYLLGSGSVFAAIVVGVIIYVLPMFNTDDDGGDYVLPLLKPPVEESAPTSLQDASSRRRLRFDLYPPIDHRRLALDATDVKSRFFSTSATNVYDILDDIDDRINEFNRRGVFSCINDVAAVLTRLKPLEMISLMLHVLRILLTTLPLQNSSNGAIKIVLHSIFTWGRSNDYSGRTDAF